MRLVARIGVAIASLVIALLLAEGAVRLLHPQPLVLRRPDVWYPVAGLGWNRAANLDTTVNFGGAGVVHLRTDAEGNRIRATASGDARPPALRVLAIGDSFVEALQVEYEETMTARVEDALARAMDVGVEVRCAGVGGFNPNQYRLLSRQRLQQARYDLQLVFLYTGNDVVDAPADWLPPRHPAPVHRLRAPRSASFAEVRDAIFHPVNGWLEERSQAFLLLRREMEPLLARVGLTAKTIPFHIRKRDAGAARWDVTADVCAGIARDAAGQNVPTAFVLIPPAFAFVDEPLAELGFDPETMDLLQPHRLLRRKLEVRGLWIIDLLPAFARSTAEGACCYGEVDSHLNAEGHRVAASVIAPRLAEFFARERVVHAAR